MTTPGYLAARVRQEPPSGCCVVPASTPVVSFGDAGKARVATLGLNPSRREFVERGVELDGAYRRFETLTSLGAASPGALSREQIERVVRRCSRYFQGNPYTGWFGRLEETLQAVGASYYDGTACHLDLSQWATDPTWNRLPSDARARLTRLDGPFLNSQLEQENIRLLLLNGAGVTIGFARALNVELKSHPVTVSDRSVTTRFAAGAIGHVRVVSWSTNLQSSFGVTRELRRRIADTLPALARVP